MKKKQLLASMFLASVIGSTLTVGAVYYFGFAKEQKVYQTVASTPQVRLSNLSSGGLVDFTGAAELSTPAVVHITTFKEVKYQQYNGYESPFDQLFREFFGQPSQPQQQQREDVDPKKQALGSGSGVIISADGYIVTNNHVINGADEIHVVLDDKRKYTATKIGVDPTTDLALLKVDESDLKFLDFANSDEVKVGEWVLAVGNPFNLTSTVTAGIVSAKGRSINILQDKDNLAIESFIQTDAAVNPGNSGGALVNIKGQLIGINTAIASPTGAFAGYSFAVPSNLVKKVIYDLKDYGVVQRALLGVNIQDVTAELAKEKNLAQVKGVYVADVQEDGAADLSGIKKGDVILKVNEKPVDRTSELQAYVGAFRPGDEVKLSINRDGQLKNITVLLRNKLGTTEIVKKDAEAIVSILGSKFQKITDVDLKKFKLSNGVRLIELGNGRFKDLGLKQGFIVVSVDRKLVKSPADIATILSNTNSQNGAVLIEGIYENGQKVYYALGL